MAEVRSPSTAVLLLRQCLACGRDSNFRGLRGQSMKVQASGCDRLDKWASSFLDVIRIQGESAARKALDSRMQRVPAESSSIASIGYAPQERVLELEFRQSGEVYQYFDVPAEEYTAFLAADSKGTYVNQQLKPRGYRYQRLPSSSK